MNALSRQHVWNGGVFELHEASRQSRPHIAEVEPESAESEIDGIRCLHSKDLSDAARHFTPAEGGELGQLGGPSGVRRDYSRKVASAVVLGRRGENQRVTHALQGMRRLIGAGCPKLRVGIPRIGRYLIMQDKARHDRDRIQELVASSGRTLRKRRDRRECEASVELLKVKS